jgi:hypothetical protein
MCMGIALLALRLHLSKHLLNFQTYLTIYRLSNKLNVYATSEISSEPSFILIELRKVMFPSIFECY